LKAKPLPSSEMLNSLFEYSIVTGQLYHKIGRCAGKVAGWSHMRGYRILKIGGRTGEKHLAHRVIWKMLTGEEPNNLDHENLDTTYNAWINLRDGTKSQNQGNRPARVDNVCGRKNIHWDAGREKWVVQIKHGDVRCRRRTRTLAGAIAYQRLMSGIMFGKFARSA